MLQLKKSGEIKNFYSADGTINFDKLGNELENVVRQSAYTPDQFLGILHKDKLAQNVFSRFGKHRRFATQMEPFILPAQLARKILHLSRKISPNRLKNQAKGKITSILRKRNQER